MDKERLEYFKKGLRKETVPNVITGGQSCGVFPRGIRLIHDDLKFEISIEASRSQLKNLQFAVTVFELFLEEFYK